MTKVLFVCVANGGRSVLAERIFNQLAHGRHEARSQSTTTRETPCRTVSLTFRDRLRIEYDGYFRDLLRLPKMPQRLTAQPGHAFHASLLICRTT